MEPVSNPPSVELFHRTLGSLPGVHTVSSGIRSLHGLLADDLRLVDFAKLPLAALRRTGGGLEHEALVQFEFYLTPTSQGWRSLEFIAWFFRDQARGGVSIQLRPFALPPQVGDTVQLGHTLRWHIDLFCPKTDADLSAQLTLVQSIAQDLEVAIRLYGNLLPEGA